MATTRIEPRSVRIPVRALSTSNLTLSGTQSVDSVSCGPGSLVGALGQSDNKNAVYFIPLGGGAWIPVDPGLGTGLEVFAVGGSSNGQSVYGCDTTTDPIVWGTTTTVFTKKTGSGSAFNPAAPGDIGGTTPATMVGAEKIVLTPVTVDPPTAGAITLYGAGAGHTFLIQGGGGDQLQLSLLTTDGTTNIYKRLGQVTLTDGAFFDIATFSKGGHGTVTAIGATGSTRGSFSFAENGTTTTNGVTYTDFATGLTPANLCVFPQGGGIRVRNNLGGTRTVLMDITQAFGF